MMYHHVTQLLHPPLTLHNLTWFLTLHVKLTLEYRVWKIELSDVIKWRWKLLHLASSATDNVSFVKNVFSMYTSHFTEVFLSKTTLYTEVDQYSKPGPILSGKKYPGRPYFSGKLVPKTFFWRAKISVTGHYTVTS